MKKFVMAAVAATFIAGPASAVQLPAEGETCGDLHNQVSRLNPTDLSDFQKCVAIEFDKDSGFLAGNKTFWVRMGTEFTYFNARELGMMTRNERVDHIRSVLISEAVIEELKSKLEMSIESAEKLEAQIEALKLAQAAKVKGLESTIKALRDDLMAEQMRIDEYTVVVNDVEYAIRNDQSITVDITTDNDAAFRRGRQDVTDIVKFMGRQKGATYADGASVGLVINRVYQKGVEDGVASVDLDAARADLIADLNNSPNVFDADGNYIVDDVTISINNGVVSIDVDLTTTINEITYDATITQKRMATQQVRSDLVEAATDAGITVPAHYTISDIVGVVEQNLDQLAAHEALLVKIDMLQAMPTTVTTFRWHTPSHATTYYSDNTGNFNIGGINRRADAPESGVTIIDGGESGGYSQIYHTSVDNGNLVVMVPSYVASYAVESLKAFADNTFADGFEQGYNAGYNDGFEDGYKVGYADGFRAGVNAVAN